MPSLNYEQVDDLYLYHVTDIANLAAIAELGLFGNPDADFGRYSMGSYAWTERPTDEQLDSLRDRSSEWAGTVILAFHAPDDSTWFFDQDYAEPCTRAVVSSDCTPIPWGDIDVVDVSGATA
jgi:hypothetical protein